MCYNLQTTIISIITHVVLSFLIYKKGGYYKSIALLLIGVASMQFSELFIHYDYEGNKFITFPFKTNINRFGSILGRFSLDVIQPIFSLFGLLIAPINKNLKVNLCIIWFILFIIKLLLVIMTFPKDKDFKTTTKTDCNLQNKDNCLLDWPWKTKGNIWLLYVILVMGLIALSANQLTFWSLFGLLHITLGYLQKQKIIRIWNPSGSCFWGPFLAYIFIMLKVPEKIPELHIFQTIKNVLSKQIIDI